MLSKGSHIAQLSLHQPPHFKSNETYNRVSSGGVKKEGHPTIMVKGRATADKLDRYKWGFFPHLLKPNPLQDT